MRRDIEDLGQFMESLEEILQLFNNCNSSGKEALLEKAEHTLRDIICLEPIFPKGKSLVTTVSDLVVCMRDDVEAIVLQHIVTKGCSRGRPRFKMLREQLIFFWSTDLHYRQSQV